MMWYVEVARLILLAVASIKLTEATTGTQLLPQNPLDLSSWSLVFQNYDTTTILIAAGAFFFLLLLVILIKKKRERYQQVVYVPVYYPPQRK